MGRSRAEGATWGWSARLAWRDSRGSRRILALFSLCVVFGIAALVAINSLRDNLKRLIDEEARGLLGADLVLEAQRPFPPEVEQLVRRLGGEQAREWRFRSMATFPYSGGASRFVQVRALEGEFPFYGELETAPASAAWRAGEGALVEENVLQQLGVGQGERIQLGDATFAIAGSLLRVAGESEVSGFFAPRIYVAREALDQTNLLQQGSIVSYRVYFRLGGDALGEALEELRGSERDLLLPNGVEFETVADRQAGLQQVLGNLFNFLNLIGFVALLLGGLGIGGAVQVYVRHKLATVALLRTLGASAAAAFRVYLLQIAVVGGVGAIVGALVGLGVQLYLPVVLADFLPFAVEVRPSWRSLAVGLVVGFSVALLFSLLPLLGVRRVSPLKVLRVNVTGGEATWRDPWVVTVALILTATLLAFSVEQAGGWELGLGFAGGLVAVLAILAAVAATLRATLRRLVPSSWRFSIRMAASNLYRPGNRTLFLMVTLGVGALLIDVLAALRSTLLERADAGAVTDAANVILIDVQPDQVAAVTAALEAADLPVREALPIVTMRLQSIRGRTLAEWRADPQSPVDDWVYGWEFRVSYRDHLLPNETLVSGTFTGAHAGDGPIPISLADNLLEDLGVGVGDEIVWDVQGLPVRTVVGSVRDVRWEAGRQNFAVIWPRGLIEEAPATFALTLRVKDRAEVARAQQVVTTGFSNVSVIDLSLVFQTAQEVLDRVAFVIQFMAGFTIVTGLVVMLGAVITSRYQRARESVLLRALGASASTIRWILGLEYALLGVLGGLAGAVLALAASAALGVWVFRTEIVPDWATLAGTTAALGALTLIIGLWNSRGISRHSPLAVLRAEEE